MNLTIPKKDLLRVAARALGIADRKSTMSVLAMLLLDAKEGAVTISATDLYRSLVDVTPAEVASAGSVAVNAKDFVDRVKALADGPVVLTRGERSLTLKSKGTARKFTMPIYPGDDYPPIASPDASSARLTVEAKVLERLISLTDFSISADVTRAHLNSALLEWSGPTIRMVSTDGHRLSKAETTVEGQASAQMLIPQNGVQMISSILELAHAQESGRIEIVPDGASAFFFAGTARFGVRLTDAMFPPYEQVIPQSAGDTLRVGRTMLADAVRAVSLSAGDRSGGTMKLVVSTGKVLLSSETPASGDASDELSVEYSGKRIVTGVNTRYLLEVLGALTGDEVAISLLGELDPLVIRPIDMAGPSYLGVVMPVRVV